MSREEHYDELQKERDQAVGLLVEAYAALHGWCTNGPVYDLTGTVKRIDEWLDQNTPKQRADQTWQEAMEECEQ